MTTSSVVPRRLFLQLLGALAAACSSDAAPPPAGAAGAGGGAGAAGASGGAGAAGAAGAPMSGDAAYPALWEILEELKQAVAGSPDHLPALADDLVAKKDARGLFALVRDRVSTVPFTDYSAAGYSADPARLMVGPRAALRSGAGSVRDKVQLLHDLLVRAGFDAKVVVTDYQPAESELGAHFARKPQPPISLAIAPARLDEWLTRFGVSRDEAPTEGGAPVDPLGTAATSLADALLAKLPAPTEAISPALVWNGSTPAVQVTVAGKVVVLQPLRPAATFDETFGTVLGDAPEPTSPSTQIVVEGIWSDDLTWSPLVLGSWPEHELAGRQVSFAAVPLLPPDALLRSTIDDATSFRPLLALQTLEDGQAPFAVSQTFAGDAFSLGGDALTVSAEGEVSVNGRKLVTPGTKGPVEQVASVAVTASAIRFPRIEVRVDARDAAGAPVVGLGSAAFALAEGAVGRATLLQANAAARRVLVLMDGSLSMPDAYLGDAAQALLEGIRGDLLGIDPSFEVVTSVTGSDVWTSLVSGGDIDPGAIVFITDGDVADEKTAAIELALKTGPRALLLDVTPDLDDTLVEMAALANGAAELVASPLAARERAVAFLKDTPPPAYLLSYDAPLTGPADRTVEVRIGDRSGAGTYRVPVEAERLPVRRLLGLRLAITLGGITRQRSLFGYETHRRDEPLPAEVDALNVALRANLRSPVMLSFDAESALPAVIADEALTHLLSYRPLVDATRTGSESDILAAWRKDRALHPGSLRGMRVRPPAELTGGTFGGSIGVTLHAAKLALTNEGATLTRITDVFSIPRHRTVGDLTADEAFRATLRATTHAALVEASVHAKSTVSELAGKTLVVALPGEIPEPPAGMAPLEAARLTALLTSYVDAYRLYASDGSTAALWVVEPRTGELYALLGDGSGGSAEAEEYKQNIANLNKVLDLIGIFASIFEATALGGAVSFAQFQVALWSAATLSVLSLDTAPLGDGVRAAVENELLSAVSGLVKGPYGAAFSILLYVFGKAADALGA